MSKFIHPATENDLQDTSRILIEASHWMLSQGFRNWNPEWWTVEVMAKLRERGELHIVKSDDRNVALFCLQKDDPDMWPEKKGETDAFYIHRIAVDRSQTRAGLPRLIIDWCRAAAIEQNKDFLRLDCADRPKLVDIYRNLGFEPVGKIEWKEEEDDMPVYHGIKMEMKI